MKTQIKKGAVDLTDMAIGIVVLGIVVTIGASILLNVRDSRLTSLPTVTTTNEGVTITAGVDTLTNTWGKTILNVTNATGGQLVASGNYSYTISSLDGVITLSNSTQTYAQPWNVTYQWYNTSQADWTLANKSALGIAEYGNWFKIIVIVGVASLVLALLFMAFGKSGSSGGGASY